MSIYILDQIRFHEFIFKKRKIFNSFQDYVYSGITQTENLIHSGKNSRGGEEKTRESSRSFVKRTRARSYARHLAACNTVNTRTEKFSSGPTNLFTPSRRSILASPPWNPQAMQSATEREQVERTIRFLNRVRYWQKKKEEGNRYT